jgi:hypothetical protein
MKRTLRNHPIRKAPSVENKTGEIGGKKEKSMSTSKAH